MLQGWALLTLPPPPPPTAKVTLTTAVLLWGTPHRPPLPSSTAIFLQFSARGASAGPGLTALTALWTFALKAARRLRGSQPLQAQNSWARLKLLTFIGVRLARLAASAQLQPKRNFSQQLHGVLWQNLQGSKIAALASPWPLA